MDKPALLVKKKKRSKIVSRDEPTRGKLNRLRRARKELVKDIKINKHSLDTELEQQGQFFYEASELYARVVQFRDKAEHNLFRLDSELGQVVRNAAKLMGRKLTAQEVKEQLALRPDRLGPMKLYTDFATEADRWKALRDALVQRSHALHDLAVLYENDYFVQSTSATRIRRSRNN